MFLFNLRPDAIRVWKDPVIKTRFRRYRGIIDKILIARYLIAKRIPVDSDFNDQETAWEVHESTRAQFQEAIRDIDSGKVVYEDMAIPKRSFLDLKAWLAGKMFKSCEFCERKCGVDRSKGETGKCGVGDVAAISSVFLHSGEEAPLVPSGTIFFAGCTFKCVFCQNYTISQTWKTKSRYEWKNFDPKAIARIIAGLHDDGALNINYVGGDPVPNIKFIIEALQESNVNSTMLWNSNFYMSAKAMELLVDIMDFWLPDFKYWNDETASKYSHIDNYREVTTRNLSACFSKGSGEMIVRHLVMPGMVESDTYPILEWCAANIPGAFVNIMGQYRPEYLVGKRYPGINRRVSPEEMDKARVKAHELGIEYKQVS